MQVVKAKSFQASSRLFRIPYRETANAYGKSSYATINERNVEHSTDNSDTRSTFDFSDSDVVSAYTWLEYPEGVSWTPERMEINGRTGRRAICVLARDRFHYRVYGLDNETDGTDEVMS